MKLNVASVSESSGISKKSGNKFRIANLSFLGPLEPVTTDNFTRKGSGLTVVELGVSDAFFPILSNVHARLFKGQPLLMDFETSIASNGKTIVVEFTDSFRKSIPA